MPKPVSCNHQKFNIFQPEHQISDVLITISVEMIFSSLFEKNVQACYLQ